MAQPRKIPIAIDDIKCRRDKMGGRSPVLFFSHAPRSVHARAAAFSRQTESLCLFAYTYVTLTSAHPRHDHFALECVLPQVFPHGSRFASSDIVASKKRLLRWSDHEIGFLSRPRDESWAPSTLVSFHVEASHTTAPKSS